MFSLYSWEKYDFSWQKYDPDLYVPFSQQLDEIEEWVDKYDKPAALVGPPGSGKTWMQTTLLRRWEGESVQGRLVYWVNAPDLINRSEENNEEKIINGEKLNDWLMEAIRKAQKHYPSFDLLDPSFQPQKALQKIAENLGNCNKGEKYPVLIVDGYDEISENQQINFSDRFLDPFSYKGCIRFVLSYREETKRPSIKSRSQPQEFSCIPSRELSVPTKNESFVKNQFYQFIGKVFNKRESDLNLNEWRKNTAYYKWDHPYINAFLFYITLRDDPEQLRPLAKADFEKCCQAALQRPNQNREPRYVVNPEDMDFMLDVANTLGGNVKPSWTYNDFEDAFGEKAISTLPLFEKWNKHGVIVNTTDDGNQRYKVIDGLRELLCEARAHS